MSNHHINVVRKSVRLRSIYLKELLMMEMPIVEALEHVAAVQSLGRLCENNQHDLILSVIQANKGMKEYLTVLLLPSFPNCLECIKICVNNLPPEGIEKPGSLGRNALIAAIILGENNFRVIQKLVEYKSGFLVNVPDALGRTAIHYAVIKGDLEILKLLSETGNADARHVDNDGNSILHQFFLFNVKNSDMLKYLLHDKPKQHMMIHVPNNKAQGMVTPGMYAMKMNSPFVVQLMKVNTDERVVDHPTVERRRIALDLSLREIEDGDLDELQFIIEKFGDSVDGNGDTLLHNFAKFGLTNQRAVDYCLKDPGVLSFLINTQNREGKTPLYILLERQRPSIVLFNSMIEHPELDPSISDIDGWVLLRPALTQPDHIFFCVFELNPRLLFKSNHYDISVFINMMVKTRFDLIRALVEKYDIDLTNVDDHGRNILHLCAEFCINNPYTYDYLLSKLKVDPQTLVNVKDGTRYGYTPVMSAIISKNTYIFKDLFHKFDIDLHVFPNPGFNFNYLTLAIKYCDYDTQTEMLKRCPELASFVNDLGETPVMVAIREQKYELTRVLIETYNVDINVRNNYGNTLLHYLANYRVKDTELIDLLLNGDRNISYYINERNVDGLTPHEIALEKDNIELANAFSKFLTTEADIAQIDVEDVTNEKPAVITSKNLDFFTSYRVDDFWSNLRVAIEENDLERVKKRIESNSLLDWDKGTPLHFISSIQNIGPNIIDFLLNECEVTQSHINLQNNHGETPLHCAAIRENIPLLNALLKHPNIITSVRNKKGETALLAAINNDWVQFSQDVIQLLVMHDPTLVDIPDLHGVTPLQASILRNHCDVMKLLIEKGKANINYVDEDGDTLAHFLAGYEKQDPEVIEYLMNKPHNVIKHINKRNKFGNTPLHAACKTNNEKYALYLLNQRRIDLQRVNNMNETPLFVCLSMNREVASPKIIENLVKKSPGMVNKSNFVGDLPILVAINVENYHAVKILIEDGKIDINSWKDKQHNTLLHYLFLYGVKHEKMFKYLFGELILINYYCTMKFGRFCIRTVFVGLLIFKKKVENRKKSIFGQ